MTTDEAPNGVGTFVLPERVRPGPDPTGLDTEYWSGISEGRLVVQKCTACGSWQWGPEWVCYTCRSFDVEWAEVPKEDGEYRGLIYSWERVWHPTDSALNDAVPYVVLLVELPGADGIRMIGNLIGEQRANISVGDPVRAVFEHHETFSLVQWARLQPVEGALDGSDLLSIDSTMDS
jgi:uncharacterized OB-fold protein